MEFSIFSDSSQNPEEKTVLWWDESSVIDPREKFRGELYAVVGLVQYHPLFSKRSAAPVLRVFSLGRLAADWPEDSKEPFVEKGHQFLFFEDETVSAKLAPPLGLFQILSRLSRRSGLDKRGDVLDLRRLNDVTWKLVVGTADVLRLMEEHLLFQEHCACRQDLFRTIFSLGIPLQELTTFAPGVSRAVTYSIVANNEQLESCQETTEALRVAFDRAMHQMDALQRPVASFKRQAQAWLKQQPTKT